jgi:hypothetical protein
MSNTPIDEVTSLNISVALAHNAHYEHSSTGLIDSSRAANDNLIYHLYSNGEITFQKGGSVYMQRSEFTFMDSLKRWYDKKFEFVKTNRGDYTSYAILTKEECVHFRNEMEKIIG